MTCWEVVEKVEPGFSEVHSDGTGSRQDAAREVPREFILNCLHVKWLCIGTICIRRLGAQPHLQQLEEALSRLIQL